eukprot:Clim_evm28s7 gene=Clim_evmTU28s7
MAATSSQRPTSMNQVLPLRFHCQRCHKGLDLPTELVDIITDEKALEASGIRKELAEFVAREAREKWGSHAQQLQSASGRLTSLQTDDPLYRYNVGRPATSVGSDRLIHLGHDQEATNRQRKASNGADVAKIHNVSSTGGLSSGNYASVGVEVSSHVVSSSRSQSTTGQLSHGVQVAGGVLDMASRATGCDHPLCVECIKLVQEEIKSRHRMVLEEQKAYEALLSRMGATQEQASRKGAHTAAAGPGLVRFTSSVDQDANSSLDTTVDADANSTAVGLNDTASSTGAVPEEGASGTPTPQTALHEKEQEEELSRLLAEQATLRSELAELDGEYLNLEEQLRAVDTEEQELMVREQDYWREHSEFQMRLSGLLNDMDTVDVALRNAREELSRLKQTDVYNDTFHIGTESKFGTINGLRLGRLKEQDVSWEEINAAWGQVVLLLDSMANLLGFTFKHYRLIPLGSFSRIERLKTKTQYPLYSVRRYSLSLSQGTSQFDTAMVYFLDCVKQLIRHTGYEVPYPIDGEHVSDCSIKFPGRYGGNLEQWTRALRCMLVDLKFLLAWVRSNTR